ncbi:MAG TPA: LysR family transcriptional regulator [Kofleriaceae bacterium]
MQAILASSAKLDLNDVSLFVRVVQLRSFSAAARERGVPVSTVSRRISRLESALGMRLLERTTRRLALTDAGRGYHAFAERAVDDLAQGGALVRELQTEPTGRVRITAPLSLGGVITDAIVPFMRAHPGITVELDLAERTLDLEANTFDLAIVAGQAQDTADFVARPLWHSSRKLLFASPGYLKSRGTPRTVEDLARHSCISTRTDDGIASWTLVHPRSRRRKFTFSPRLHVSDTTSAQRAVRGGIGIAMLPEVLCVEDVARGRLTRVLPQHEGIAGGLRLLFRAHRSLTAAVRAAVTHLTSVLPTMDPHA